MKATINLQAVRTHVAMLRQLYPVRDRQSGKARAALDEMVSHHMAQLDAWYEVEVGYRPLTDDPAMTAAELADLCASYLQEMECAS